MSKYEVGGETMRISASNWKGAESDTLRRDYVSWSKSRKVYAQETGGDGERHQLLLTEDFANFLDKLQPELKDLHNSIQLIFTALSSEQACQMQLSEAEAALANAQSELDEAVKSKSENNPGMFWGFGWLSEDRISNCKATVECRTTQLNRAKAVTNLYSLPTSSNIRALDTRLLEVEKSLDAKADQGNVPSNAAFIALKEAAVVQNAIEPLDQRILEMESHLDVLKDTMSLMDRKPAFWTLFKTIDVPQTVVELDAAVDKLVELHATAAGIDDSHRVSFLNVLHADGAAGVRPNWMDEVGYKATRYWTSAAPLGPGGPSFCSVVANANRTDNGHLLINGGISFQKALNSVIVTRGKAANAGAKFPDNGLTHRGCGIPHQKLKFWTVGKKYRAPSPLASSFNEDVAKRFLDNVNTDTLEPVHFVFNWKRTDRKCQHACYVESVTAVSGEEEIVVAAYSAFEVTGVQLHPSPTVDNPHKIYIDVFPDNRQQPESLPLAIWH